MPLKNVILVAILIAALSACAPPAPQETGTLEGHVTIGPLSPVVQAGASEP